MARVLVTESYLTDIADAIREQNNSENTYTPSQMATAILTLSVNGNNQFPVADNCSWGTGSSHSAYEIPDDTSSFGGS